MRIDRLDDVRGARVAAGRLYEEFLRMPSMSAGFYELPAGGADPQGPPYRRRAVLRRGRVGHLETRANVGSSGPATRSSSKPKRPIDLSTSPRISRSSWCSLPPNRPSALE